MLSLKSKFNFVLIELCSLALTKIDVLDSLKELKVAVGYKLDGVLLPSFPGKLQIM